jgi:hypothetical protein
VVCDGAGHLFNLHQGASGSEAPSLAATGTGLHAPACEGEQPVEHVRAVGAQLVVQVLVGEPRAHPRQQVAVWREYVRSTKGSSA